MKPYQARVVEEKTALDEKIQKLDKFIDDNNTFNDLSDDEQELLTTQLDAMQTYAECLNSRIELFNKQNDKGGS